MRRTILRLLSSFRAGHTEHDLAREIRSHLQLLEDQYVASGMTPDEARHAARRAFGGVEQVKQLQREARMFRWLAGWPMDLKLGGRMLVKYPGLTIVGGLAMAFAICVGIVIFQVVSLFTNPTLPLSEGARLVELRSMDAVANVPERKILHDFLEWRQSLRSLTDLGAWRDSNRNLVIAEGEARPVKVAEMSVSGFRLADGDPLMGRMLTDADERVEAPPVAVIGYHVWRTRFGSDPRVLGRSVQLGHEYATVVGVMREGFEFPVSHDVWLPLKTSLFDQGPRSGPAISVFARLAPGVAIQAAQAELTAAGRRVASQSPGTHQHLQPLVRPYAMMVVPNGPGEFAILYSIYFFIVVLLVLISGNVGLLLFARAASREADLVVRTALGASRGRLVAQMFTEALVLGSVAAIAGLLLADVALRTWGIVFLETNLGRLPFWFDLGLSPRAIGVAVLLTVAGTAIAGVMPALKITRGMAQRLRQNSAGSGGLQFGGVWTVVIVAQVAATVIFPALVYWEQMQLRGIEHFAAGFDTEHYLAVQIERDVPGGNSAGTIATATLDGDARLAATLADLRSRLVAQPGVMGVTFAERLPTTTHMQKLIEMGYDLDGGTPEPSNGSTTEAPLRVATIAAVDPSYFDVLDAPVVAGRGFAAADTIPGARVAIVDHSFVEQVLKGRNAIGQRVRFRFAGWAPAQPGDAAVPGDWYEVIGVVPDLGVGAPTQKGRAAGLYFPGTPDRFDEIHMMVRVRGGDPMTLAPQVRDLAMAVDPSLRLVDMRRVDEANDDILWVMGLWLRITAVLSSMALVLSLAGIYAVLSFTVARRTREIGVRVALGASRRRVILAVFRRPLLQVASGIAVGTAIVFSGAWMIRYTEFPGSDRALTFQGMAAIVGYGLVMLCVCSLGCLVPTRRALGIEPTVALRAE
jgi:putative ABC transport system permease protein